MRIDSKTKLDDLLKTYPFLLEFLSVFSPKFAKLKNPVLRKTVGKLATLGQIAGLGDMPADSLLSALAGEIARVTGEDVHPGAAAAAADEVSTVFQDKETRLEVLKDIIRDLHGGVDIEVLRKRFAELVKDLGPTEIPEMEQRLIEEGMPESEVKRLCDVHVQVFKESLEGQAAPQAIPGHPIHTLMAENRALESILSVLEKAFGELRAAPAAVFTAAARERLILELKTLAEIEKHYVKKENQLFPLLEDHNVSGPSKVMWTIHDDVRAHLKELAGYVSGAKKEETLAMGRQLLTEIRDMIYKEEKILFPMALETLDERDWARVKHGEEVVGYAWITPGLEWKPAPGFSLEESRMPGTSGADQVLKLDTGALTPELINLVLKHLPLDISFVDENDEVRYFSDSAERIFSRSPAVIGRKVQNCHPPASFHIVETILKAFKAGTKDAAEFWITSRGRFLHIRYFAVRDKNGTYKGCLEASQDVTEIRALQGQRRLLDWE
ncbi:MAG: DUF438 domain-containing protein [Candidatus Aminicenantes bacterium]|nr:DUF438 domain-containing protein [Candidatus Aminicenantes bacterium]